MLLQAGPDDVDPRAGQDAYGVGVIVSAGASAAVEIGGPWISRGETHRRSRTRRRVTVCRRPTETPPNASCPTDASRVPRRPRRCCASGVGNRPLQSPISAKSRAARTVPACWQTGEDMRISVSAELLADLFSDSIAICLTRDCRGPPGHGARVIGTCAAPGGCGQATAARRSDGAYTSGASRYAHSSNHCLQPRMTSRPGG